MTIGGWIIMLFSVVGMTGLLGWCVARIVRSPHASEHLHTQADIDPGDAES